MLPVLQGQLVVGQMVSLGGYPSDWLLIDQVIGKRLRLRRSFGKPAVYSPGFWVDAALVRELRWPDLIVARGRSAAAGDK